MAHFCAEALFWLIVLMLVLAPLAHGAGSLFTQGPLMLVIMLAAVLWAIRLILVHEARVVFSLVGGPVVVLATYVVVRYTLAEVESVSRWDMMLAVLAALVFFLLLNNIRHRWQVTTLAWVFTALGTLEALVGGSQVLAGRPATGTFTSPADYTIYLQLAMSVAVAKFLFSRHSLRSKLLFAFGALLMAVGILLGGVPTLWAGLVAALGVITVYLIRRRGWRFRWAATGLCVLLLVAAVGAIGLYTLRRQSSLVLPADLGSAPTQTVIAPRAPASIGAAVAKQPVWSLPPLWKSAVAIGQRNLLLGAGPGMFRWVFPSQRRVQGQPQSPGNAYLGMVAEYGLSGLLLLGWLVLSFVISIVQILKLRAERYSSAIQSNRYAMAVAGFAALAAVLVDGLFDFNPRVAGNLLTVVALLATALTCGVQHHGKSDETTYQPGKHSTLRLTGVSRGVLVVALAVFVLLLGSRLVKSYPVCLLLRSGQQEQARLNWNAAAARYRQAWQLDRRSFAAVQALGDLYCARATWDVARRAAHATEACQWYDRALVLNPYATDALISMGRLHDVIGQRPRATAAYQQAVQADPNNAAYYLAWGLHYQRWGEPGKATECFATARDLTATYGVLPEQ